MGTKGRYGSLISLADKRWTKCCDSLLTRAILERLSDDTRCTNLLILILYSCRRRLHAYNINDVVEAQTNSTGRCAVNLLHDLSYDSATTNPQHTEPMELEPNYSRSRHRNLCRSPRRQPICRSPRPAGVIRFRHRRVRRSVGRPARQPAVPPCFRLHDD